LGSKNGDSLQKQGRVQFLKRFLAFEVDQETFLSELLQAMKGSSSTALGSRNETGVHAVEIFDTTMAFVLQDGNFSSRLHTTEGKQSLGMLTSFRI
jgi:hypothetical protein